MLLRVLFLLGTFYFHVGSQLVVQVSNGYLNGARGTSRIGREFHKFLGVPYAKPPIGNLRFEPPEPAENWEGTRDAAQYGNRCIQSGGGAEDCLFLNVFSPNMPEGSGSSETPVPVIFYIHGGGFWGGQSNWDYPEYFMDEDVVLVTINYRLHSMGFLNTNNGLIRGNMGLKDIVLGLKWVQENIHVFGGDPAKVTIFGFSAGAAAVSYLMLSPSTVGLFAKAISRSGVATKIWSFQAKPEEQAILLAERLNCPTQNASEMVACLKQADPWEITRLSSLATGALKYDLEIFLPTIELDSPGAFLTRHPFDVIQDGEVHKVPYICGVNSGDGSLYIDPISGNQQLKDGINANWTELAPKYLYYDKSLTNVTTRINEFYFGSPNPKINFDAMYESFMQLWADRYYASWQWNVGMRIASDAPVYLYYNDFHVRRATGSRFVKHGEEMGLYFPSDSSFIGLDSPLYNVSRDHVSLYVQFASTNSTDLSYQGNTWRPVRPETDEPKEYLVFIDGGLSNIQYEPLRSRMLFWDSLNLYRIDKYNV